MGTEDDARKAQVDAILAGGQEVINRYMIAGIMYLQQEITEVKTAVATVSKQTSDIQDNGCKQRCADVSPAVRPHIIASGLATLIVGVYEAIRAWASKGG